MEELEYNEKDKVCVPDVTGRDSPGSCGYVCSGQCNFVIEGWDDWGGGSKGKNLSKAYVTSRALRSDEIRCPRPSSPSPPPALSPSLAASLPLHLPRPLAHSALKILAEQVHGWEWQHSLGLQLQARDGR